MNTPRETLRPLTLASFVLLATGIFVAPYLLPPNSVVRSASTIVGFNNALAYVLYLIGVSATAWILSRSVSWEGPCVALPASARSFRPTAAVWWIGLVHAVGFLLLYSYKRQFVFADGLYFQHVALRVASGAIPYSTVGFMYGPATLYPVVFLSKFMSITDAYALYYVVVYLSGLYALFAMLRWCVPQQDRVDGIFIALAVGFFNPITALNYTFVRHLLPALTVLSVWAYLVKPTWGRLLCGTGMLWISLMYSADIGLVAVGGVMVVSILTYGSRRRAASGLAHEATPTPARSMRSILTLLWVPGLAFAMMLLAFAMIPPGMENLGHYLEVVSRFSAGGSNTPVEVSLPLLAMVALLLLAFTATIALLREQGLRGTTVPLVAVGVTCVMMQRAAFGKPDVVHIAYAALPALIMCFAATEGLWGWRKARTWLFVAVLSLALPLQYYHALLFRPFLTSRLSARRHTTDVSAVASQPIKAQLDELVQKMGSERTYYMHNLMYYSLPTYLRFQLKHALYFTIPEEIFSEADIDTVLHQLAQTQAAVIMLRSDYAGKGPDDARVPAASLKTVLDALTASPLPGSKVYQATATALHDLWRPFVEYVRQHYTVRAQTKDLVGLVPRTAGTLP